MSGRCDVLGSQARLRRHEEQVDNTMTRQYFFHKYNYNFLLSIGILLSVELYFLQGYFNHIRPTSQAY